MFNKLNLKWLIGIFALLLLIVFITIMHDKNAAINHNRSFKSKLTDFDTTRVTSLIIIPKSNKEPITLSKEGKGWMISSGGKRFSADESAVKNMLESLISMTPERIAAKDQSGWKEYEVTDSTCSKVQIFEGKKMKSEIFIGKFNYQQPKNPNPYNRQQGTLTSFVRVSGDNSVYALDGLLSLTFNRQANDFRNHVVINSDLKNWTRLSFTGPDKNFILNKQNNHWMIDGQIVDSASVSKYLISIEKLYNSNYIESSVDEKSVPEYLLTIEGNNIPEPIKVKAFKSDTTNLYAISSSQNAGSYFSGKQSDLFKKIFVSKNSLVSHSAKP